MLRRVFSAPRLLALAILVTLPMLVAPAAEHKAPGVPPPTVPSGPATSATPSLSWSRVCGATGYEFQSRRRGRLLQPDPDGDHHQPDLRPDGPAEGRHEPLAGARERTFRARSAWSRAEVFVDGTAPPTPISPIDDVPLPQPESPALLQWSPVSGAVGYQSRSTPTATGSALPPHDARHVVPGAHAAGARGVALASARGPRERHVHRVVRPAGRRDVRDPAPRGRAARPDDGARWDGSGRRPEMAAGARRHEVRAAGRPRRGLHAARGDPHGGQHPVLTDHHLRQRPVLLARARHRRRQQQDGLATEPFSFWRGWPQKPELVWPPNQLSCRRRRSYFQWTPVRHATRYQLDVGPDVNFSPNTFSRCFTASTTFTLGSGDYLGCMPSQGQRTYWRVKALDAPRSPAVEGIFSDIQVHLRLRRVRSSRPPTGPGHRSHLALGAVTDAVTYKVEIRETPTSWWRPPPPVSVVDSDGSTPLNPAKGPFSWTVQSMDYSGSVRRSTTAAR